MILSLIAAMSDDRVIGTHNRLPWRMPADMRWFRKHTLGKPVVMGRRTFESLAHPLPERTNIVITRDSAYQAQGCQVAHSLDEAIAAAGPEAGEIMVIGGESLYRLCLPHAQRMYLTLIHGRFDGDAWFPGYNTDEWREIERTDREADEQNPHACSFVILEHVDNT